MNSSGNDPGRTRAVGGEARPPGLHQDGSTTNESTGASWRACKLNPTSADELFALIYQELRQVASGMMAREAAGQTLQPTALVHEAWLRLARENKDEPWAGRTQFFAAAAEAMRRILVENARRKSRIKRGGGWQRVQLEGLGVATAADDATLLVVNEALEHLEAQDLLKAKVVKLRFFGGLTAEEIAPALGVSVPTVKRHWRFARAWLLEEIERITRKS